MRSDMNQRIVIESVLKIKKGEYYGSALKHVPSFLSDKQLIACSVMFNLSKLFLR